MIDQATKLLLEDMLANARIAQQLTQGHTLDSFSGNVTDLYAATHATEIIGEAASQIDPAMRGAMPSIPWKHAIRMRNRLIHGYRTVLARVVYETIRDDFPPLIAELERILNTQGQGQP